MSTHNIDFHHTPIPNFLKWIILSLNLVRTIVPNRSLRRKSKQDGKQIHTVCKQKKQTKKKKKKKKNALVRRAERVNKPSIFHCSYCIVKLLCLYKALDKRSIQTDVRCCFVLLFFFVFYYCFFFFFFFFFFFVCLLLFFFTKTQVVGVHLMCIHNICSCW